MKLESKLFDSIRVKNSKQKKAEAEAKKNVCGWMGCERPAAHKAPLGKNKHQFKPEAIDGKYVKLCLPHVREYNATFNFFEGACQEKSSGKDYMDTMAQTGDRPTWGMGINKVGAMDGRPRARTFSANPRLKDPLGVMGGATRARAAAPSARKMSDADRKAFLVLGLDVTAKSDEIKTTYKDLVKRHHPDANGGDAGSEERLRNVITAYNQLKSKGFVS